MLKLSTESLAVQSNINVKDFQNNTKNSDTNREDWLKIGASL